LLEFLIKVDVKILYGRKKRKEKNPGEEEKGEKGKKKKERRIQFFILYFI